MKSKSPSLLTSKYKSLHYLLRSRRESRAAAACRQRLCAPGAAITRTAFIFHGLRRRWQLYLWLGGGTSQWVYSSPAAAAAAILSKHTAEKKPLPVYSVAASREATQHLWKVNLVNVTIRATTIDCFSGKLVLNYIFFFSISTDSTEVRIRNSTRRGRLHGDRFF